MQPACDAFFGPMDPVRGPDIASLNRSVRAYVDEVRSYLLELHDEGTPSRRINEERSDLFDRLIRKLFRVSEPDGPAHADASEFRAAASDRSTDRFPSGGLQ